jgi:hypothetical protein
LPLAFAEQKQAAGEAMPPSNSLTGPGIVRAAGLRARADVAFIVTQTKAKRTVN